MAESISGEVAGISGFAEHSRRPYYTALKKPGEEIEAAVLALRDKTVWGGPKIAKEEGQGVCR